jgi:uncharacterized membrane protein required for colicin V production
MNYDEAARTRRTGLLSLIAEKKFQDGKSLGSSIGGAISDKFKAKAVGFKEKFDPLNMIRGVVGKGVIGKSLVTLAGRAMGKDEDDIRHFGGYGSRKRKLHETLSRKDPLISTIGPGAVVNIRPGDTAANILAKTYNFMEKTHETYKRNYELDESFRKEQLDEDERRHKKLIDALLNRKEPAKEEEDGSPKSFIEKILDGLKKTLSFILKPIMGILNVLGSVISKIVSAAISGVIGVLTSFITTTMTAVAFMLGKKVNQLIEKILIHSGIKLAGQTAGGFFGKGGGLNPIAAAASVISGALILDDANKELFSALYGDDFTKKLEKVEELRPFNALTGKFTDTPEKKKEREDLTSEAELDAIKYQKDVLIPAMKNQGYEVSNEELAGHLQFKDFKKDGQSPGIHDIVGMGIGVKAHAFIKGAANSLNNKVKDQSSELYDNFLPKTESIKSKINQEVKPILNKLEKIDENLNQNVTPNKLAPDAGNEVKSIPRLEETDSSGVGKNDQVVSVNNTQTNIGGGAPKMVDTGTTALRNNEIYNSVYAV